MAHIDSSTSVWTEFLASLEAEHGDFAAPAKVRAQAEEFARRTLALLFPHFELADGPKASPAQQYEEIERILTEVVSPLVQSGCCECSDVRHKFKAMLPGIREALIMDAHAMVRNDPAAESFDEVVLSYPGFLAVAVYRIAHVFYQCGVPFFPRLLTEFAHRETGVDIHPGASIGSEFAIDHGTGIVIGETTEIGDRVCIYQGVTLGALSVHKSLTAKKRHPTVGNGVVIYAGATILGGQTVIGDRSVIGGNAWVTRSVPPDSTVTTSTIRRDTPQADESLEFYI